MGVAGAFFLFSDASITHTALCLVRNCFTTIAIDKTQLRYVGLAVGGFLSYFDPKSTFTDEADKELWMITVSLLSSPRPVPISPPLF
jgi:hypothetical protein